MKIIIILLSLFCLGMPPLAQAASDEAALYLDAARTSMQHQDWAQAEERLLKVIKLNFHALTARYLLGKVAEQRGDLRLAKKRYKMVLLIDSKHLPSLVASARMAEKLNTADRLAAYQRVMRLEPNKPLWHLKVAQFYMQKKSIKAKRYLNNVLSIDPNHRQALEMMIEFQQKYTLIAHTAVFQRHLDALNALNNLQHMPKHIRAEKKVTETIVVDKVNDVAIKPLTDVSKFQHYVQAVKQGRAHDQYMLGLMHHEGRGTELNDVRAAALIKKAASQGLGKAQCTLGLMLYEGIGSTKKEKEGIQWMIRAAKQGEVDAQYALGLIYTTSNTFKNNRKAVQWWKLAAAQNNAKAQHNLAVMYFKGQGVKKSLVKTQYWLQQEAQQDKPDTIVNIDHLYSEGDEHRQLN